MDTRTTKLAAQVNVKYRTWARASDKASVPYPSPTAVSRSVNAMQALVKYLRDHDEVFDHQNGETFSIVTDTEEHVFRWAMSGDPVHLHSNPREDLS